MKIKTKTKTDFNSNKYFSIKLAILQLLIALKEFLENQDYIIYYISFFNYIKIILQYIIYVMGLVTANKQQKEYYTERIVQKIHASFIVNNI